jgi:hypothetical protein
MSAVPNKGETLASERWGVRIKRGGDPGRTKWGIMRAEEGWKRTLWPHAGEAGNVQVRRLKNILRIGGRSGVTRRGSRKVLGSRWELGRNEQAQPERDGV